MLRRDTCASSREAAATHTAATHKAVTVLRCCTTAQCEPCPKRLGTLHTCQTDTQDDDASVAAASRATCCCTRSRCKHGVHACSCTAITVRYRCVLEAKTTQCTPHLHAAAQCTGFELLWYYRVPQGRATLPGRRHHHSSCQAQQPHSTKFHTSGATRDRRASGCSASYAAWNARMHYHHSSSRMLASCCSMAHATV